MTQEQWKRSLATDNLSPALVRLLAALQRPSNTQELSKQFPELNLKDSLGWPARKGWIKRIGQEFIGRFVSSRAKYVNMWVLTKDGREK